MQRHAEEASARTLWALGGIAVGGLLLRQAGLQNWSYWLDEAMQVSYVRGGLKEALQAIRFDGVHPPLDYLFTWLAFHVGGGRERILRVVPAVWMTLACVVVFAMAGGTRRPIRSLGAALFLAATPLSVYIGQEVRPYALALLLVAGAFALLERQTALTSDRRLVLATACCSLACMTLYLTIVPLSILWASVLWRAVRSGMRPQIRRALLLPLPPLFVLGAWLWSVRGSLVHAGERFPVDLSVSRLLSLFNGLLGWRDESPHFLLGAPITTATILLGVVVAVRSRDQRHLLAALGTTFGVIGLLALTHHWISLRYLALALIPLSLLFGSGIEFIGKWRHRAPLVLVVLFLGLHVPSYRELFRGARPNWRQVAAYLAFQREHGQGGVVLGLDDWSYLCLRAQPLIREYVTGFVSNDNLAQALRGEGWLIKTPHYHGAFDSAPLTAGVRPWARCPEAEDAHVYRFANGALTAP